MKTCKKFLVTVSKEWTEPGEVIVEADDEEAARELAQEMLADGDDSIQWFGSNMDPGQESVESVTPVKESKPVKTVSYQRIDGPVAKDTGKRLWSVKRVKK